MNFSSGFPYCHRAIAPKESVILGVVGSAAPGAEVLLMNAVKATFKNGQIIPAEPVAWPEGTELRVEPVAEADTGGLREEDWQTDPEAVADWLRWYASLEPLEFTPEEEAGIMV
jgi:hypothetical protein